MEYADNTYEEDGSAWYRLAGGPATVDPAVAEQEGEETQFHIKTSRLSSESRLVYLTKCRNAYLPVFSLSISSVFNVKL